jgi:hypothetical protein
MEIPGHFSTEIDRFAPDDKMDALYSAEEARPETGEDCEERS